MHVHNAPPDNLEESIKSVLYQRYQRWELCICDDNSTSSGTIQLLEKYRGANPRIKIIRSAKRLFAAKATNLAAEFTTGQFVAFLNQNDSIESSALELVVRAIEQDIESDIIYSDEDRVDADGRRSKPYLKPDWSPELLLSMMFVGHLLVVRKSLFLALDGFRDQYLGAHDYDFALRATTKARRVTHVPSVLYHSHYVPTSNSDGAGATCSALINGKLALTDFVQARVPGTEVVDGLFSGSYRVKWPIDTRQPVMLLVLTGCRWREIKGRGRILLVENTVKSIIERSSYANYKILVFDDGAMPADVRNHFIAAGVTIKDYHFDGAFNYSKKVNYALDFVETEDVIVLNDDIEVIAPDWIEALLEYSRQPEIGVVGAMLLYPNDRIQHAGVVLGVNGPTAHIFHNQPVSDIGYCGFSHVIRNYSAVSGAVHATRMSIVRKVGGLNPDMAIDYSDIDFCLRVRKAGYRIVYSPYAKLYHFEGSSIARKEPNKTDQTHFLERWQNQIASDPYYNPGLPRDRLDCALKLD
jgi:GT2 family glycosyltransferase